MAARHSITWRTLALATAAALAWLGGCASDSGGWGDDGVSTSVSVGVGYGSYYGPGWYGGYYDPYPPVVIVPPGDGERPPGSGNRPERPTTLPAEVGGNAPTQYGATPSAKTAPSRPASAPRPTSRPSPRPAPRPMPRMGRR
jgi:hypothetical protein